MPADLCARVRDWVPDPQATEHLPHWVQARPVWRSSHFVLTNNRFCSLWANLVTAGVGRGVGSGTTTTFVGTDTHRRSLPKSVQVLEAGKSMALWQGVFGGTPEATMQVRLIATMGDAEITCEATLP